MQFYTILKYNFCLILRIKMDVDFEMFGRKWQEISRNF